MPCVKKLIHFSQIYFLYVLVIFDFRSNGQIINSLCNITKREFQPPERQNAGYSCPGITSPCTGDPRYYTADGSCNNLNHTRWGATGTPFVRLLPAEYSDGNQAFRKASNGLPLPNTRKLSVTIFTNKNVFANNYNVLFYGFAQWVDHDMTFSVPQISQISCCDGTKPIPNPPSSLCLAVYPDSDDYYYSKYGVTCLDMKRAISTKTFGCQLQPIDQINFQTAWLDLSLMYGSSVIMTSGLRTFRGGELKIGATKQTSGQIFPPIIPIGCPVGGLQPVPGGSCFAMGDSRLLQNPELTVNEVTFFRMHNHIAHGLHTANPEWNEEMLFAEARKILVAKYQHVVYTELVPALIGKNMAASYSLLPQKSSYLKGYNPELNGQVTAEFSAAAGRILHSLVRRSVSYKDATGYTKKYNLRDKFFNQQFLLQGNTFTNIIESFGNAQCSAQDQFVPTDITNHLSLGSSKIFGQDLVAIDINRGRDFGIPSYNVFRKVCGLCPVNSFQALRSVILNPTTNIPILEHLYKNINDVDFYVLGILEKPVSGGLVGPTMACILAETFYRAKFADRLFYEFQSSGFTEPQLQDIRKTTYAQFLCLTNNITSIPAESLSVPTGTNPEISCKNFGDTTFSLFKNIA